MSGTLYLVATPIGNLGDISPRAAETLAAVDFIAAEDTRVTMKLLNHLGIKKPLVSYYQHNSTGSGQRIVERLLSGESCALVSDAGMPAISDPGEPLVAACAAAGIAVAVVPGPCAAVAAVALSGLPTGRFTFEGFLSTAKKSRFSHLETLRTERRTMVFYEAPHKLLATLQDLYTCFGNRRIAVCRELTKLHEETLRFTLAEALVYFENTPPRGEFVLVVDGATPVDTPAISVETAVAQVLAYRDAGLSMRDAVKRCADETGLARNVLYDAAVKGQEA